jgi:hypothetical protein
MIMLFLYFPLDMGAYCLDSTHVLLFVSQP